MSTGIRFWDLFWLFYLLRIKHSIKGHLKWGKLLDGPKQVRTQEPIEKYTTKQNSKTVSNNDLNALLTTHSLTRRYSPNILVNKLKSVSRKVTLTRLHFPIKGHVRSSIGPHHKNKKEKFFLNNYSSFNILKFPTSPNIDQN